MSIRCHNSLKVAKKVLTQINKIIPADIAKRCYVESYANCREQGLSIVNLHSLTSKRVCFSEHRNSDDIVVYKGESLEFNVGSNIPPEKVYRKARYFRYNDAKGAADFIINYFKD